MALKLLFDTPKKAFATKSAADMQDGLRNESGWAPGAHTSSMSWGKPRADSETGRGFVEDDSRYPTAYRPAPAAFLESCAR